MFRKGYEVGLRAHRVYVDPRVRKEGMKKATPFWAGFRAGLAATNAKVQHENQV